MARSVAPELEHFACSLLLSAGLEPAAWLGPERAGPFVPLAAVGIDASPELVEYMRAAEELAFRKAVAALTAASQYWCTHPVRSPSSLLFQGTPSQVVAFLAGSVPIATDPDSGACLVAAWGKPAGRSAVASFLFNDVAPSEPKPGDFVCEAESIEDFLTSGGQGALVSSPAGDELARRYRRGIWIAQMVHGTRDVDPDLAEDVLRPARDASPLSAYQAERKQVSSQPQIAAYWLLSHALLGHVQPLADALERARGLEHPVVVDLCARLAPILDGVPVVEKLLAKHRPEWTTEDRAAIRGAVRA